MSGQASPPPNACSGKLATRAPVPATPATRLSSGAVLPRRAGAGPLTSPAHGALTGYCAQIRDGERVPHVRHWAAFHLAA